MKRILGIALIVLAGGHAMQAAAQELPVPPQRISQNSYSFMPPAEFGWRILMRREQDLALVRRGTNPDETYAIQARTFGGLPAFASEDEFVQLIRKALTEQGADPRFAVLKHEVSAEPSTQTKCAKSHFLAEDRGAVRQGGRTGAMILEIRTLNCAHPKRRDVVVSLMYSQRYDTGQADPRLAEKAAAVLASLEFLD